MGGGSAEWSELGMGGDTEAMGGQRDSTWGQPAVLKHSAALCRVDACVRGNPTGGGAPPLGSLCGSSDREPGPLKDRFFSEPRHMTP